MTGSPIPIGLVGIGKIARDQHLPAIAEEPRFRLKAMASRHAEDRREIRYETVDEMLAGESDLVAVSFATPPQGRAASALAALEAGKHVMLEKPPCATIGEARMLAGRASELGLTLFASWHSREAAGVAPARTWLRDKSITGGRISWREDVRQWHPGQEWIFTAAGMGVFDPGINALSVLTEILPGRVTLAAARLEVPSNREAPIRADIDLMHDLRAPVRAEFDFLHPGEPHWTIAIETDGGNLLLEQGGARLSIDGEPVEVDACGEYPSLYAKFAGLIAEGASDVDLRPFELVADAMLAGTRHPAPSFDF